jgi:hypothetical protein
MPMGIYAFQLRCVALPVTAEYKNINPIPQAGGPARSLHRFRFSETASFQELWILASRY